MPKKRRVRANGEGSYRVRGDSVQFRWPAGTLTEKIGGRNAAGLRSRLAELASTSPKYDSHLLFSAWVEAWYKNQETRVEAKEITEGTHEGYSYTKAIVLRMFTAGKCLVDVTAEDIETGMRDVRKPVKQGGAVEWAKYDFRTIQKCKAMLGQIFKAAVKAGKIERDKNPMLDVDKLRNTERPEKRKGAYSNSEIAKLYRNLKGDRAGHLVRVCIACGFRGQEMLALGPDRIEPDGSMIEIGEAVKRGRKGRSYIGETKTPKSDRSVYVPAIAQPSAKYLRDNAEDGYILPNGNGGHIGWTCYRERYYKAVMDAGVVPIKPHRMRHTFTTVERVMLRESDSVVMSNTGHTDMDTVEGYTDVRAEDKQAAAGRLDAFLRGLIDKEK